MKFIRKYYSMSYRAAVARMLFILVLICILPLSRCQAQSDIYKTMTVDGRLREYLIHVPPAYDSAAKMAVILALHGGGGSYKKTAPFYHLDSLADKKGFIVVYPDAIAKSWTMKGFAARSKGADTTVDDVHFISVLLDTILGRYKGDSAKVFATGISRGGEFSLYLADKLSSRITAIAPVCASVPKAFLTTYSFKHPTPVLLINGTADPLIPYDGGFGKYLGTDEPGEGFDMAPTDSLIKTIAALDSCAETPAAHVDVTDNDPDDSCTAIRYIYIGPNVIVALVKIINGGHTWPGGKQYLPKFLIGKVCRDFKAEDEIFDFFLSLRSK